MEHRVPPRAQPDHSTPQPEGMFRANYFWPSEVAGGRPGAALRQLGHEAKQERESAQSEEGRARLGRNERLRPRFS